MPYKEKRKQVNKDSQRKRRGDTEGVTGVTSDLMTYEDAEKLGNKRMNQMARVTSEGITESPESSTESVTSGTWETIPLKEIKEILPSHLEIEVLGEYDRLRQRSITLEGRFRRAYKYHVWHEANFTDGIHNDSKFRGMIQAGK